MGAKILVFGGTGDAIRATEMLVKFLGKNRISMPCVYSLAGVTKNPRIPDGACVRTGGFGGVQGIVDYILQQRIRHIFDFTHPYARHISHNINRALSALSLDNYHTTLYRYNRPPWHRDSSITYVDTVRDIAHATQYIPGCLFVALGAKHAPQFFHHTGHVVVRSMRDITVPNGTCIVAPPPEHIADERALFDTYDFKAVVCKDSGTKNGHHKITVAKQKNIPIYMLSRPDISNTYDNTYIGTDFSVLIGAFCRSVVLK